MLGIIGAMAEEVEQLKAEMKETKVVSLAGMDFYKGKIQESERSGMCSDSGGPVWGKGNCEHRNRRVSQGRD